MLTNWYVRRSRQRFWDGDADAIDTLHTVLEVVCRVTAPLLPLTTEAIWRGLTGERSVHLTDWPDRRPAAGRRRAGGRDGPGAGDRVGVAVGAQGGRAAGAATAGVADRRGDDTAALQPFSALLADEVNVREVELTELADADDRVSRRLTVNARAAGPRLGRDVQQVIKAAKSGDWTLTEDGVVTCGGFTLADGEYTLELVATGDADDAVGVLRSGGFVALDTHLDDELVAEGTANDVLRLVQQARRDAGFHVSDRVRVALHVEPAAWEAVASRREWFAGEALAVAVERGSDVEVPGDRSVEIRPA